MERRVLQHNELPQNARYELERCGEGNALFDRELLAYKQLFEEDETMDDCYKILLTSLLSKENRVGHTTTQKVKEEADETLLHLPKQEVNKDESRKTQGDKAHLIHENSRKAMEDRLIPHKKRKSKHLLIEHKGARANAEKAFIERRKPHEERNGKLLNNNVCESSRKASQERSEPHKKREGKEHLIEYEDAEKTLGGRSEPHHKRKGLLVLREKVGKAFEDKTEPHLKRKGKDHFIEDNDVPENGMKKNARGCDQGIALGKDSEIKKFPPGESRNNERSRRYEDGKSKIERCPARELRDAVRKKKMFFQDEGIEIKKEGIEIKKSMAHARGSRNANTKLRHEVKGIEIKKQSFHNSREAKEEEPTDEEIETKKKHSTSTLRNDFMKKKLKYQYERVKAKKRVERDTIMEISSDEDGEGNILKCLARDSKNVMKYDREIIKKSPPSGFRDNVAIKKMRNSEDERMEIKKMSTSEFRSAAMRNRSKYEAGVEKRLGSEFRNVRVSNRNNSESDDDYVSESDFDFFSERDDDYASESDDDYEDNDDGIDEEEEYEDSDDEDNDDDDIDEEESEDSDREIIESASCHKGSLVGGSGRVTPNDSVAEFRRRVLEVISNPYDKIEYNNLKEEFEARRCTYNHPDVGKILRKYKYNRRKCLAILRGYYFWNKNAHRKGAFKPWRDDMCLAVEP